MHFFRAAFLEEGIKFALLIFICVKLEALDEPIDAIVYGATIGLGYAAMENLGYLYSPDAWSLATVKMRYYPLVMHLGFGVVMGWLLSLNLFDEPSKFNALALLNMTVSNDFVLENALLPILSNVSEPENDFNPVPRKAPEPIVVSLLLLVKPTY